MSGALNCFLACMYSEGQAEEEDKAMKGKPAGKRKGDQVILKADRAISGPELDDYPPLGEKQRRGPNSTQAKALRRGFFG